MDLEDKKEADVEITFDSASRTKATYNIKEVSPLRSPTLKRKGTSSPKHSDRLENPLSGGKMVEMYESGSSMSEIAEGDISDEGDNLETIEATLSVFTPDVAIIMDKKAFKYGVSSNRMLRPRSLARVLKKGGRYIFNIGLVQLFEMLILNMFLVIYSYKMETELIKEMQEDGKSDPSLQAGGVPQSITTPYILNHQYAMF